MDTACSSTLVALDIAILRLCKGLEAVICSGGQLNLIIETWPEVKAQTKKATKTRRMKPA